MSVVNLPPKHSKCKAGGRWVATKNHNVMYFLTALAIPGLFIVHTSFNAYTGWIMGGTMLALGFIFLDFNMAYFWAEVCGGAKGVRKFLCFLGFVMTFSCAIISLFTCVSMFDARKSLDYAKVDSLTDEYNTLLEQQKLVNADKNPDNFIVLGREVIAKRKELTEAKYHAQEALGYAPEHALFVKYGWDMEWIRTYMSLCMLFACLISISVYRTDDTTDDKLEAIPVLNDKFMKPRKRIYNTGTGDGVVTI
jgi:hypothetical protein